MKKVLSVVLALLMLLSLATVALADCDYTEKKGTYGKDGQMLPGESYRFEIEIDGTPVDVETKTFKVTADIDKDSAKYVEATGSAGGCVYVKTKNTYAVDMDDPASIDIDFTLTARKDNTDLGIKKGDEFYFSISYDFGNNIVYVEVEEDDPDNANMYNATAPKTAFSSDGDRGWVNFDCGDIDVLMLMPRNGTVNFGANDKDIEGVKKLSTSGSYECVTFDAQPKVSGTATLSVNKKYDYVYSYSNGTLTPIKVTENGSYNQWKETDTTLGAYVLSTAPLSGTAAATQQSSSAAEPAPAPSSSAAPAPAPSSSAAPAPETSVSEPVSEPVEEPVEEPETPVEEEIIPEPEAPVEEEEPVVAEPEEKSSPLPVVLLIVAAALVVAVLIALLASRSGRRSRR